MKKTDLSIVIVTFNNQDIIRECLQSICEHVGALSIEIFLIDNQSSDQTREILSEEWPAFSQKHYIFNTENKGYTRGINQGLEKANGEYVLILNPDVVFSANIFPALFIKLRDDVAVVAPQLRFPDGRVQPSCRRFPEKRDVLFEFLGLTRLFKNNPAMNRWRMPDFDHLSSRYVDQPQGAFLLTTQQVLQKIGLLDEQFYMFFSDVEWCKRIYEKGYKILFDAEHYVFHVQGASIQKTRKKMIVTSHRSFIQYFQKYDTSFWQKLYTAVVYFLLLVGTLPRLLIASLRSLKR